MAGAPPFFQDYVFIVYVFFVFFKRQKKPPNDLTVSLGGLFFAFPQQIFFVAVHLVLFFFGQEKYGLNKPIFYSEMKAKPFY